MEMVEAWPFFGIMLANAEASVGKADMGVAELYASLVADRDLAERVFGLVRAEYDRCVSWLPRLAGRQELLGDEPVLRRAIARRNPRIDPLHALQVEFLGRLRQLDDQDGEAADQARRVVYATILGIAAGLKATG